MMALLNYWVVWFVFCFYWISFRLQGMVSKLLYFLHFTNSSFPSVCFFRKVVIQYPHNNHLQHLS